MINAHSSGGKPESNTNRKMQDYLFSSWGDLRVLIEELCDLSEEVETPPALKRKMKSILCRIRDEPPGPSSLSSSASSSSSRMGGTRFQQALKELLNGGHITGKPNPGVSAQLKVRAVVDISSRHSVTPRGFKRANPATIVPTDAFAEMNEIMTYSLCYVNVDEIEFDIFSVKENDGSLMEMDERRFLSVCSSVFANFSFVNYLDLPKLMRFLSSIYGLYVPSNPFRNATHAADSLQLLSLIFRDPSVNYFFMDEEILFCFLSVLALNISHQGVHNGSLSAMNHNMVQVFGPSVTVESCSLIVFFHELFHEENYFVEPFFHGNPQVVMASIRETISATVNGTSVSNRCALTHALERIARSGVVRQNDMSYLTSALTLLAINGFAFRGHTQCFRLGKALRNEFCREVEVMERLNLPFFLSKESLGSVTGFIADYCTIVVNSIVELAHALVPVDLVGNFRKNMEMTVNEEAISLNELCLEIDAWAPWEEKTASVISVLHNASTFGQSLNRQVSKMAILNASSPRKHSIMDYSLRNSPVERRSEVDFGSTTPLEESSLSTFSASPSPGVCKPEHAFLLLKLYDKFEWEGRTMDQFLNQLIFLALQLDPGYISQEARQKYTDSKGSPKCVEMARYIMQNEEAPLNALQIIQCARPVTSKTDSFILQLIEMYKNRSFVSTENGEGKVEPRDPAQTGPSKAKEGA